MKIKPEVFVNVFETMEHCGENLILCGNFNLVMDPRNDHLGIAEYENNTWSLELIKEFQGSDLLV